VPVATAATFSAARPKPAILKAIADSVAWLILQREQVNVGRRAAIPMGSYGAVSGFVWAGCVCQGRGLQALVCLRNGRGHGDAGRGKWPTSPGGPDDRSD
jgi:hypothetical protein